MKSTITKILHKALKEMKVSLDEKQVSDLIEIPPNSELGDFAFPCFFLAGKLKKNPAEIAMGLRQKIGTQKEFQDIQTQGPYINFFVNRNELATKTIAEVLIQKENFGKANLENEKLMIEFSQPNTHKAFHVGHIRGTSLGESLARINEFCGKNVIRANYSGDTGMHIAKWIWCYKKFHAKEKLSEDEAWIASIYVDAVKRLAKNEKLQTQVDEINRKIESKEDKEINSLWEKTRKLSINSWGKIYEQLGTHFDVHYFESELESRGKEICEELLKKGIAIKSEDAVIMDLKKYNLGVWVLLRKDGTVLYSAKDLALAERKVKEYNLDKSLIIVGNEQDLHFQQLFKTLELSNFPKAKIFSHLPFAMVRLPTGKMSSRTGDNVIYSDFIKELITYAKKEIKKRETKVSAKELESRALIIAVAAIKYSFLKQDPNKTIIFSKEDALRFEGNTGPYLLYSYARASSILRKAKKPKNKFGVENLEQKEFELTKKISDFQSIILKSYTNLNPALIANYTYELAQIFNEFYHACPVINSPNEDFRLHLVEAFRIVLKKSLNLLGIETIEEM